MVAGANNVPCKEETGGTCRLFGCSGSRGQTDCVSGKCICKAGFCAAEGICNIKSDRLPRIPEMCMADTGGTCHIFGCDASRGDAECKDGHCICKNGLCNTGGRCDPPGCSKDTTGTCYLLGCSSSRGPVTCQNHKCICQDGYCNEEGVCRKPQAIEACPRATGGSCHIFGCASSRGEVECVNQKCICKDGYCNNRGICRRDLASVPKALQLMPQCQEDTGGTCKVMTCRGWRGKTTCMNGKCICDEDSCSEMGACHKNGHTVKARVVQVNSKNRQFPDAHGRVKAALCISGGGTRAMTVGLGVLRAMEHLGFMKSIDGVASASGGTWAAAIYMFADRPISQLLGDLTDPSQLTMEELQKRPCDLGYAATVHTSGIAAKYLAADIGKPLLWTYTITKAVLGSFGLDDKEAFMAVDEEAVRRIKTNNPHLANRTFFTLAPGRPKAFVMAGIMLSPSGYVADETNAVSFQMSPDFVGSPFYPDGTIVKYDSLPGTEHTTLLNKIVGGGFVESFAFGGQAPPKHQDGGDSVMMAAPIEPMSLAKAVGVSSDGPSVALAQQAKWADFTSISALSNIWPITSAQLPGPQEAMTYQLGDGGNIDNSAVITMLQRGATKIISLLNTQVPLPDADFCGMDDLDTVLENIKTFEAMLSALFGMYPKNNVGETLTKNQVFPKEELAPLLCDLQTLKKAGKPTIVLKHLDIVENSWWGVRASKASVLFCYSEKISDFEALLPEDTQKAIHRGSWGPFSGYPQYNFVFQNPPEGTALTAAQVNLLAAHAEYGARQNEGLFRDLLGLSPASFLAADDVKAPVGLGADMEGADLPVSLATLAAAGALLAAAALAMRVVSRRRSVHIDTNAFLR
eukprot:TRINITY_DN64795_c0_g1_i1.p1 TRINITY_DN64795_c0_g1~~TRINITY_DN64795_c0_g1_i1.p1  ORF type:complete len:900 (-),score=220.23 TRINITY_DN64795_c0_g1_i1:75-2651(-)